MRIISTLTLAALLGVSLTLSTDEFIEEQNKLANEVCFIKDGLDIFDLRSLAVRDEGANSAEDYKVKLSNTVYGSGA